MISILQTRSNDKLSLTEQLFGLTGVPPDGQRITVGSHVIEDDTDLNTLGLEPNQVYCMMYCLVCIGWGLHMSLLQLILLVGSAEEGAAPAEQAAFTENRALADMHASLQWRIFLEEPRRTADKGIVPPW